MTTPPAPPAEAAPDPRAAGRGAGEPPKVLAILVSHNGTGFLTPALRTIRAQRYPALRVVAVDNGSTDDTSAVLARRLGEENVVTLDTNVGFGRGVAAALRAVEGEPVDYVLLLHDDMALMPDAVQWLVDALESDPTLAVAGPKLREWGEEPLLQQVGMSADVFGHPESLLGPDELDQGQRDGKGDVLFVSTAGMLIRRELFTVLGGFDPRFDQFGEDMDLCLRTWVSGRRVAVVPQAVGFHVAATDGGAKGRRNAVDRRYRLERHTIAALLKNLSARRLAWVLPVGALVNVVRVLWMVLSRRFGEALAVVRAYLWNLAQLPATLRRRRAIQATRRLPDRRLAGLFAPGLPRAQSLTDAVLEAVAGGTTKALVDADDVVVSVDPLADQPIQRFLRDRPLVLLGVPLLLAFLASLRGYLGDGQIIGGEIAAWPDQAAAFLRAYLSPVGGEPLASFSFPSPVQAVLGLASVLLGGSAWLAQRVLVFGLVPLAFVVTLRAGRLVTSRGWPRVIGAAAYATSPVVLGALGQGRYGIAVLGALLPGLVALTIRTADPATAPGVAWRSAALLSFGIVLTLGSAPVEGLLGPAIVVVAAIVALLRGWFRPLLRLAIGGLSAVMLLAPWLFDVLRDGGPPGDTLATVGGPPVILDLPLWQALLGQPRIVDGLEGGTGAVLLAVPIAILIGALFVGMRARPLITGALVLLMVASGAAGWAASYYRMPLVWPPALLLPGAVAMAVLAVILARWSAETLTASDFGAGQVGTGVAGLGLTVGLVAGLLFLAGGPWTELRHDPQLVPAFIGADDETRGPYRVLLLDRADDGTVRWEVTGADGPSMVSFGTIRSQPLTRRLDDAVTQAVAGAGDAPGATLGLLNVRYVVLLTPDAAIQQALARQRHLEPLPTTAAVAYQVASWLPRAAVVPDPAAGQLARAGLPPVGVDAVAAALDRLDPGEYAGAGGGVTSGLVVLSEAASGGWRAAEGGTALERMDLNGVNAFTIAGEGQTRYRVVAAGGLRRRGVVAVQLLIAFGVLSLALRPPGRREQDDGVPTALPSDLVGLADTTTTIPRIDLSQPPPAEPGASG